MTLRDKVIRLAHSKPELRPHLLPILAAEKREKVTLYFKTAMGSIGKTEGYLLHVSKGGVHYIPKRGRKERMIMTYYSSFIMVVKGWGKPDPEDAWEAMESNVPGASLSKARYRGFDPRWVSDFLASIPGLKPLVFFEDGKLKKIDPSVPQKEPGSKW